METRSSVLIVDDQPENIHLLLQALQHDHAVLAATDGEKALRLARRAPPPDVILLDVMMPAMDGYEVCRRLKEDEATRDIPVLFVTALGDAGDEARGLAAGGIDYIAKPVNPDLVRARVANHIALRQAARLKEDVERILRHDLRGALSGVIGLPRLVRTEADLAPEHAEMLKAVEQAGFRMLQMLNLGLDLYKMEQGVFVYEPAAVNLAAVLRDVAAEIQEPARSRNVPLVLQFEGRAMEEDDCLVVMADPLLCHCMASNLARNALEASPSGAAVTLAAVRDQGHGSLVVHNMGAVPKELRGRFFQKYATAGKAHGTGLGAYSARLMARTMGGDIDWDSDEERGTRIEVRLPLEPEQADSQGESACAPEPSAAVAHDAPEAAGRVLRVLVVDDDLQAGMLLKRELQALGHEAELASHGAEALSRFAPGSFQLVLMDKEMPVMDGLEACGHIRRMEQESGAAPTHLVALTGHDAREVHEQLLQAGFSRTMRKPLTREALHDLLREAGLPEGQGEVTVCEVEADMRELLEQLLENLAAELAAMPGQVQARDFEALRKAGHKRKGTCRAYGLAPLAQGFEWLEAAANAKDATGSLAAVESLAVLLDGLELRYTAG